MANCNAGVEPRAAPGTGAPKNGAVAGVDLVMLVVEGVGEVVTAAVASTVLRLRCVYSRIPRPTPSITATKIRAGILVKAMVTQIASRMQRVTVMVARSVRVKLSCRAKAHEPTFIAMAPTTPMA